MEAIGEVEDQRQHDHTDDADQQPVHAPSSSPTTRIHNGRKSLLRPTMVLLIMLRVGPMNTWDPRASRSGVALARSVIRRLPETDPDASRITASPDIDPGGGRLDLKDHRPAQGRQRQHHDRRHCCLERHSSVDG